MRLAIQFGQFIILIELIFIFGCGIPASQTSNSIRDSFQITSSAYQRMLEAYKEEPLGSDTLLLGFRIGMTIPELRNHMNILIANQKIVRNRHRIFALIPTNEYYPDDKDSVHQLVAEMVFHLNEKDSSLKSIYASLHGPRFYITPLKQRVQHNKAKTNPLLEKHRKIVGDSFYNEQQRKNSTPEGQATSIRHLLSDQVLEKYRIKYGSETHIIPSEIGQKNYIWISQGKIIELILRDNYYEISKEYLNRTMPSSKSEFSGLIQIGSLNYSSVKSELEYNMQTEKAAKSFQKYVDSLTKDENQRREVQEKEHVNKTGI